MADIFITRDSAINTFSANSIGVTDVNIVPTGKLTHHTVDRLIIELKVTFFPSNCFIGINGFNVYTRS
nr:hypothetical protein [Mucilaginibacter agri]